MIVAFSVSPSGGDETGGVGAAVAQAIRVVRASGLYAAGFQVGIMAVRWRGLLYEKAGLAIMIRASAALVLVAPMSVTAIRGAFEIPQATSRK